MNELHVFAGTGSGILGGMLLGNTPVCAVEVLPYRREVLLQRQRDGILPWFPIWDDIRTFDASPWRGCVDVVCGGFPCQDISLAKQGAEGIDGSRSGLWSEMARVIRDVGPDYVLVENSPALVIRGLGRVLGDLAAMGFNAEWGVLGADNAGMDHRRKRIWILAYSSRVGLKRIGAVFSKERQARVELERLLESESRLGLPAGSRGRIHDGTPRRVDRIAACGDSQVPAVVKLAWETLSQ